ncbi:unnamed protein product [Litomosoides sigmodontis]|uniref:Uncharacterized protein n=1 Tax=Litomosoides sigmodontis TaxID=42156 RepID=A0A3P6V1Z2_LITSI|nr:unnamed protein product [Litomosoides sigmodontis]
MMNVGRWFISLLLLKINSGKLGLKGRNGEGPLEDPTTNYYTHPIRSSTIFVKVIFREKCKKFIFSTSYNNESATPYVLYETTSSRGAKLNFGYDYDRELFKSLNSKYGLVFSSTDNKYIFYFINGQDKMLMDTKFDFTRPTAHVSGCNPQKQRIIIRQSPYVDPFNWGSYLWMSNTRAFGSVQQDDTIICSLRYFPAGQGSFMIGSYGQRNRSYLHSPRSFMGLTLNYDRTRFFDILSEKKKLFLTLFGAYDENNFYFLSTEKTFDKAVDVSLFSDILLEKTHDEFDLSIAMTVSDSTVKYRVTGSIAAVYQRECGNAPDGLPDPCKSDPRDFYFGCLHVGYYLTEEAERIPNRTASRCSLAGPTPYRSILDRSQQLKYTYGYWEDLTLMRMQDEGNSTLFIDGVQMIPIPSPGLKHSDATNADFFDWF